MFSLDCENFRVFCARANCVSRHTLGLSPVNCEMGKKVFLGGLSWASTPGKFGFSSNFLRWLTFLESLCNFFTNLNFEVEKAVIICDKPTGKSRGFGFMVFSDSCCLDKLQSHYKVDGRLVSLEFQLFHFFFSFAHHCLDRGENSFEETWNCFSS